MKPLITSDDWPLIRFIAPAFPEVNIFSRIAEQTTPLGIISVATAANKVWGWRVEVIDENNYKGPRDERGLPDHEKLQKEDPASVVGFYCGLSSTMDRVFELAKFYYDQGAINIAGGWHAHYCPEETLKNNIDIVVHGDGEIAIQQILTTLKNCGNLADIPGISFWFRELDYEQTTNPPQMLELPDLSDLPYPDFGLLRHVKKIKLYPIGRVRGCAMNCEFCSVKGKPRWASPLHVFNTVKWLVEKYGAKKFFIVDDRLEENLEGVVEFFRLIHEKYRDSLDFSVQIRLETARNIPILETMKKAGVSMVCIGYESPIDEDLKAMRKGYLSKNMAEWTKTLRRYFWVHGMFIFGYPNEQRSEISVSEMVRRFKVFIREAKIDSIQVLHPVPLVGTDLRKRLDREGRIFPLNIVRWRYYDGNYPCFIPDNMTLKEFQEKPIEIMKWFYSSFSLFKLIFKTFHLHYFFKGWKHYFERAWLRDFIKYGGHLLIRQWQKKQKGGSFLADIEKYANEKSAGLR